MFTSRNCDDVAWRPALWNQRWSFVEASNGQDHVHLSIHGPQLCKGTVESSSSCLVEHLRDAVQKWQRPKCEGINWRAENKDHAIMTRRGFGRLGHVHSIVAHINALSSHGFQTRASTFTTKVALLSDGYRLKTTNIRTITYNTNYKYSSNLTSHL